jgi:hypothetical protein
MWISMNWLSSEDRFSRRYAEVPHTPFSYSMGLHQDPANHLIHPESHLQVHYFSSSPKASQPPWFMVGYEPLSRRETLGGIRLAPNELGTEITDDSRKRRYRRGSPGGRDHQTCVVLVVTAVRIRP